jgi:hypothetical protein
MHIERSLCMPAQRRITPRQARPKIADADAPVNRNMSPAVIR